MNKPFVQKILAVLCLVVILSSCQKETSTTEDVTKENPSLRATGAIPDDPAALARVPLIVSSAFMSSSNALMSTRGGTNRGKDSDGDGIPDKTDACPAQKETVNGYQDTDGCPDTAPAPSPTDTDGDGIADGADACPTQKETFNGYQDADGCPDIVPDTDGDGIIDTKDGCITEKETANGYQDEDGCPDTEPVVLPPATLPTSVSLNMPPVGNQGTEFSCVPFAVGYAARSAEQYYKNGSANYSNATNLFSPEFLYNQTKFGDCGSGTAILTTLEFMKNKGICTWQTMPYSSSNGCDVLPGSTQLAEASNYRISGYSGVYKSDVIAIKTLLAEKHPLMITVVLDQSFTNAQPGFIWKSYSGSNGFSHALAICGYDDAKHAFKVMNSWGTGWGDAGYSWIDYDFLKQTGDVGAYVIHL